MPSRSGARVKADLEFGGFGLSAIPTPTDRFRNALLTTLDDVSHLLNGPAARCSQTARSTTRRERNPVPGIFAGLRSEQKSESNSNSETHKQTQDRTSLLHDVFPFALSVQRGSTHAAFAPIADSFAGCTALTELCRSGWAFRFSSSWNKSIPMRCASIIPSRMVR
jgi:hypothetical protein